MTKTGDLKSEETYEVLPAAESLDLPLGIRCMEVNVQEVDDAVRQFSKRTVDIKSPSWKFPHVTLEKLDVAHVMTVFRGHNTLSDNQLYMELMELLIDRLYYAIITSYEFFNGLEAMFFNAGFELDALASKKDAVSTKRDWNPLEIAKRSVEDNIPKPFHTANIGMLVRQFCLKMVGLENIVLNNIHHLKKTKLAGVFEDSIASGKASRDGCYPLRHSETQTEVNLQDGCDSCFIAQNILKCVAENIDLTLKTFNESDTQISKVRFQLRKDVFSITQRGALQRWLKALGTDCESICKCANMLLDINVKSQDDIRALRGDIEIKEEHYTKELAVAKHKLTVSQEELKHEQECRTKISKLKDAIVIKLHETEKNLERKMQENENLHRECEALQRSFNIAEELNVQIKSNFTRCSTELELYQKELQMKTNQNEIVSKQLNSLSEELAKAGQQVMKLTESAELSSHYANENRKLHEEVVRLRKVVEKYDNDDGEMKRALDERDSKIGHLTGELKSAHSKIEVLTLYPDLNGPLNTPMKATAGGSSCIETMEMQIKSNRIRMEILHAQSERLKMTVGKLRDHMKKKSTIDLFTPQNMLLTKRTTSNHSVTSSGSST